jgi:cell division protein FtsW
VVLVVTAAVVFYVAGLDTRYIKIAFAVGLLGVIPAILAKPYRLGRIVAFVDPEYTFLERHEWGRRIKDYISQSAYTRDPGYHARQSKMAVGSGGLTGMGLMKGEVKLLYLPEAHNDFIYAVIGEELGLAGTSSIVLVFLLLLWRGLRLSRSAPDEFGRFLALAVTTMLVVQAFMNMSVVLGMAPTKGIPLPMISYGGSSLLSTLIALGMLMSISEQTE